MRKLSIVSVFVILAVSLGVVSLHAAGKKFDKILIKAAPSEVNGQQFPDLALEDSVKDLKKIVRPEGLAANESEADYLLVVVERKVERSNLGQNNVLYATLSFKEGGVWKPAIKLNSGFGGDWRNAARKVINRANDWIKANRGK